MSVDIGEITVSGTAQHSAWRDRILPPVEQVRPGLWSIPTPFTNSPLRYVLAYLVETSGGLALVDTGWPSDEAWDGLVDGVRQTGHDIVDVAAVLVTHGHADHFGLARKVREASGARIGLHTLDADGLRHWTSMSDFSRADTVWLARRGVPADEIAGIVPNPEDRDPISQPATVDLLLEDGDHPMGTGTPLRVLWTPGHTPGHVCFVHEEHDVLLTGDHILPRISPNISPSPQNSDDTLGDYLGSLAAMAELDVSEVLPAHEYRFTGLPARVRQLQAHHAHRLAEILEAVAAGHRFDSNQDDVDRRRGDDVTSDQNDLTSHETDASGPLVGRGPSTLEVAEALTWSRPWSQSQGMVRRSAIGETYAHLLHLVRRGLVTNAPGDVDNWQIVPPLTS